ncbi:MAG: hypothetical protein ACTSU8_03050 [Alphaproteobacteria bacterium]
MLGLFFRYTMLIVALSLFGCQPSSPETSPVQLKLEKYAGELKIIKLAKDGQVLSFLYDTGGGYTVLDASFAETFGCIPFGKTIGFRMTGEQVESQNCNPVTLDFGEISVEISPKVMDINSFLPDGLPKLAGLISLQTFQDRLITIDYEEGLVTIDTPESFAARTMDMTEIPLKVTNEKNGESVTMFTQVLETPEPLWFCLDSGNLRSVLVAPYAAELLGLENNGPLSLQIAGKAYETTGEVMDIIYDGALDVRFFKAHVIALDLKNSRAWVKRIFSE